MLPMVAMETEDAAATAGAKVSSLAHLCHLVAQLEGGTLKAHVAARADLQDEAKVNVHDVALVIKHDVAVVADLGLVVQFGSSRSSGSSRESSGISGSSTPHVKLESMGTVWLWSPSMILLLWRSLACSGSNSSTAGFELTKVNVHNVGLVVQHERQHATAAGTSTGTSSLNPPAADSWPQHRLPR